MMISQRDSAIAKVRERITRNLVRVAIKSRGYGYVCPVSKELSAALSVAPRRPEVATIFDVGSASGDYAAAALKLIPNAQIFAFEPSKPKFDALRDRFKDQPRVTCVPLALGSVTGEAAFFGPAEGSEMSSLIRRDLSLHGHHVRQVEVVEVVTLDDYVRDLGIEAISILKLDVEGNELEVLKGGIKTIRNIVDVVQFEFGGTSIDAGTYFRDYWNYFVDSNFDLSAIVRGGVMPIDEYSELEELMSYRNLLASRCATSSAARSRRL
jgi:FkbM family methyltransferase